MIQKYKIPIQILKLDKQSYHLLIEGKINKQPVNLIIDTGASRSIFDINIPDIIFPEEMDENADTIHSASISAGSIDNKSGILKSFKLGKLQFRNFPVVLIDLEEMNKLYVGVTGKKIHGLLGSDFLLKMDAVINYGKSTLILKK